MPGKLKYISVGAPLLAAASASLAAGVVSVPLQAQEVVQALPAREAAQLKAALRQLALRPTNLDALVSAGNASLALRDTSAAAGFFTRAAAVAPADGRVLLGMARVALEQRRPVAAVENFAQAERAGIRPQEMAADRALAYDLVGDNAAAQAIYRTILASDDKNTEVRRRLALSLAIAGNRSEFERVLYPMLRDEDRSAYRTRAFGLAVLGRPDEAVAIADAMMPTDLALRMAPYLRYMPRLTRAQQAAAGNLGAFPAAAEIGRDSTEIASYASAGARIAANASASLTPAGAPLGPRNPTQAQTRTVVEAGRVVGPVRQAATQAPAVSGLLGSRSTRVAAQPAVTIAQPQISEPAPVPVGTSPQPVVVARAPAVSAAPPEVGAQTPARLSLADAFADLQPTQAAAAPPAGAVDIAALAPARKVAVVAPAKADLAKVVKPAPKPKPKAEKPVEPARHWAQIGVGRNTAAFAFDWRKLAKQAGPMLDGKGPWAVKYGATNRMLAGPFATEAAAKAVIKQLKGKGIEALPFRSDEGEKVAKIG